jgi:hypothetical protein
MPYVIQGTAILEVQVVGRLHGQITRSVLHYAKTDFAPVNDGNAFLQAFSLAYTGTLTGLYRACCSNEFTVVQVSYQWIKPTRYRALQVSIFPNAGTVIQNSLPSGAATVLSKTTPRSGRKWRGRVYLPAIPQTFEADSLINATGKQAYDALAASLNSSQIITGTQLYPWVNKDLPTGAAQDTNDHTIDSVITRDVIRYQRRREVGVGE